MNKTASVFGSDFDQSVMSKALQQAQVAQKHDEVPIGAVIVDQTGSIIAMGHNQVESLCSQTAHAEHVVLAEAGRKKKNWRLEGCWLYVTLEPCAMCMHLIMMSRLDGVVYGAESPVFGFHLDKGAFLQVYKRDAVQIVSGICAVDSIELLQSFFKQKREKVGNGKKRTR